MPGLESWTGNLEDWKTGNWKETACISLALSELRTCILE